jgi:hypothetical protein
MAAVQRQRHEVSNGELFDVPYTSGCVDKDANVVTRKKGRKGPGSARAREETRMLKNQ